MVPSALMVNWSVGVEVSTTSSKETGSPLYVSLVSTLLFGIGSAVGVVVFNNDTGFVNYIPETSESNSTVSIVYQVCNILPDPSVCATATIYIEIGANALDAVDDTFTAETGDGGTIPNSNVLSNDTYNGEPVSLEDVVLTSTPTDQLTINADGTISVVPGTEAGTYTIEYTICDVADSANCDTATVTVEVLQGPGNVLDAVDDTLGQHNIFQGNRFSIVRIVG